MHSKDDKSSIASKLSIFKYHSQIISTVLDQGKGLFLSEIRDMINNKQKSNLLNKNIKCFLLEQFGDSIKFSNTEWKSKVSGFIFDFHTT